MTDRKAEDVIKKLKNAREHNYVLLSMLNRAHKNIKKEITLATETQKSLDEILFELTGDKFYKSETGEKK